MRLGKGFEKRVLDELNSRGVNAKPISFKREEEFECDVVFVMQNKIFVEVETLFFSEGKLHIDIFIVLLPSNNSYVIAHWISF